MPIRIKGKQGMAQHSRQAASDILDWGHLARYTLGSPVLEQEIIDLFLPQLAQITARLKTAPDTASWRLAVHTLKGSAAAVGAIQIGAIAAGLEELGFESPAACRADVIAALDVAIGLFREAVG